MTTDTHFPYRVLGCQQDNSSVRILSRTYDGGIGSQDWSSTAGFESGHLAADPLNDDIVYGGNYGGYISRLNHKTGENRTVSVYPVSPIGDGADTLKYRFQWNFPILFSPHNPKKIYAAGNKLFVTEDEGQHWKAISPDLTTNDKSKQVPSGGIITKDNTGVEYYCTLFAVAESAVEKDVIWCGSDDGLIHLTRNGGMDWELVNPKGMPEWMMINCIEPSPFDGGTCYVVGTRYKLDDETPYIYKTTNYGKTWKLITKGIPSHHFARCLRADPVKKGILYCGTEQGMYISDDDGLNWDAFQLNLPTVPITDLTIKNNDLIVATQGRAFWILDDLTFLHQLTNEIRNEKFHAFQPAVCYRMNGYQNKEVVNEGMNPVNGLRLDYWLRKAEDSAKVTISIYDKKDTLIRTFTSGSSEKEEACTAETGMNMFVWNLNVKGADKVDDMILWNGNIGSYKIPPGEYKAKIKADQDSVMVSFVVKKDPNYEISDKDYTAQFDFLNTIKKKFDETQKTIKDIRNIRNQISALKDKMGDDYPKDLDSMGKALGKKLTTIEEHLYQTKAKSGQDVLNYPIRLNDKLAGVFDAANQHTAPTQSALDAYNDVAAKIDLEVAAFKTVIDTDVKAYNKSVRDKEIGLIMLKK
ncbi:hypothetical protein EMGBS15_13420 [Filimonas sp.]|nr:hypothetical protein EMGBS15_13420 [Filimonas sp.]